MVTGVSGAGALLAQQAEPTLFGWHVGLGIGFLVVLVVVVIVSAILTLAAKIRAQAKDATRALYDAQANSMALWELGTTNRTAREILDSARTLRKAVEG